MASLSLLCGKGFDSDTFYTNRLAVGRYIYQAGIQGRICAISQVDLWLVTIQPLQNVRILVDFGRD
jgi:hypothetical protein